mgnify:CR=1 FL=1
MSKRGCICLLIFICGKFLTAQNYYPIRHDGKLPRGYILDKIYEAGKTVHLTQPAESQLSAPGQIPFNFYFYNKPYTQYKVSDNGYITFDLTQNVSLNPDTVLPLNSILGFWQDFKLQQLPVPNDGIGVQAFSYTVGQAPSRAHIIQFYGLTLKSDLLDKPITNASIYAFAIILYEGSAGRFDVVFSPYGNKELYGTIGCNNEDNTSHKILNDTLCKLPFQFSFDPENFIVYQFAKGTQPDYDLAIREIKLGKIYQANAIVNFTGVLANTGKKEVSSLYLNYAINAGDTISHFIDGINLKGGGEGSYSFSHPVSWLSGATGSLNDVNFWLSKPGGMEDEISSNSNIHRKVLRNNNNYTALRNILFEEATGAWCGYCPDAHLLLKNAIKQHGSRIVPVSYHIEDSMSNESGNIILSNFVTSYPDAILDRKIFLGSTSTWMTEVNNRLNVKAPVAIQIEERSFNEQTREIGYRVRVKFTDYWYGNLRLGSIVTENNVRGNALPNIWSQYNYYSKDHAGGVGGSSHPLYNEKEHMDGYIHQYVQKAMPGGPWGNASVIPQLVTPNSEYTMDYTYVLPAATFVHYEVDNNTEYCNTVDVPGQNEGWNIPANINLIGYVAEYNDTDVMDRPVINAGQRRLWDLSNTVAELKRKGPLVIFPNPADNEAGLKMELEHASGVKVLVTNQVGDIVLDEYYGNLSSGSNLLFLKTSGLASGIYQVYVITESETFISRLSILR